MIGRLSEHISIHEGYRKFRCGSCDRGFTSPSALKQHEEELSHGPLSLVKTPSSSISTTEHDQSPTSNVATGDSVATESKSEVPVPLVDSDDEPIEVVEPEAPDSPEHDDSQYANDFVIHDNPMPIIQMDDKKASDMVKQKDKPTSDDTRDNKDNENEEDDGDGRFSGAGVFRRSEHIDERNIDAAFGLPGTSAAAVESGAVLPNPWIADMHNHNYPGAFGSYFWCSICDAQLASFQECEAHCFSEHYRYPCMYCTKTFAQKANRDRHICIHTGEKPFACPECDQRFARGDKLKIHRMKWHNIQFNTPYMRMPKVQSDQSTAQEK